MTKRYDRDYFQRWYPEGREGIRSGAALQRRVALAVALAEFALERPIRSVLDVGCGEGAWRAPLRRLRPGLQYLGLDSSAYAVQRYGRSRNLALASFGDLAHLRPCAPVDLLVCADVLHYVPAAELHRGASGLTALCGGVAWIETFCRGDDIEGDTEGWLARPPAFYRRLLERAGLRAFGPFAWLAPGLVADRSGLELLSAG